MSVITTPLLASGKEPSLLELTTILNAYVQRRSNFSSLLKTHLTAACSFLSGERNSFSSSDEASLEFQKVADLSSHFYELNDSYIKASWKTILEKVEQEKRKILIDKKQTLILTLPLSCEIITKGSTEYSFFEYTDFPFPLFQTALKNKNVFIPLQHTTTAIEHLFNYSKTLAVCAHSNKDDLLGSMVASIYSIKYPDPFHPEQGLKATISLIFFSSIKMEMPDSLVTDLFDYQLEILDTDFIALPPNHRLPAQSFTNGIKRHKALTKSMPTNDAIWNGFTTHLQNCKPSFLSRLFPTR